jgi:hypothetical protein
VDLQSLMVFTSFMDMQSLVICNGGYAELRRYAKLNGMQEHVGIIQGGYQTNLIIGCNRHLYNAPLNSLQIFIIYY